MSVFINYKDICIFLIFVRVYQICILFGVVIVVIYRMVGDEEFGLIDSLFIVIDRQIDSRDSGISSCQQRVGDGINQQGGRYELCIGVYDIFCGFEFRCGYLMENIKIYQIIFYYQKKI